MPMSGTTYHRCACPIHGRGLLSHLLHSLPSIAVQFLDMLIKLRMSLKVETRAQLEQNDFQAFAVSIGQLECSELSPRNLSSLDPVARTVDVLAHLC